MNILAVAWWVLVLAGLIPSTWFLVRFRPAWPIRQPSLIVNGLVAVIWLAFLRQVLVIAARGGVPQFPDVAGTVIGIVLGAVVDVLLILLLIRFLRYRREHGNGREEKRDE